MIAAVGSRLVILLFGTLYPAYASYKAVRNKDVKAYVQWMMYWIVFALFTCVETFSDVFLSFWVPFYYELKVVIVLWLLSPATKGSSLLYRKFVHPTLTEREREIDEYLAKMKERSYSTMLELGSKGINYALQTAIKGGGGLVSQLRKSYSLSDLTDRTDGMQGEQQQEKQQAQGRRKVVPPPQFHPDQEADISEDDMDDFPMGGAHRGYTPRRSASGSGRVEMYFPAMDVDVRKRGSTPAGDAARTAGHSTTALSNDFTDGVDSGLEVEGEPLIRTASLSSTRASTRTRRPPSHGPGVVTTPSGRTKSINAVAEVVAPVDLLVADDSSDSDSLPSHTTSEQITVVEKQISPPDKIVNTVQVNSERSNFVSNLTDLPSNLITKHEIATSKVESNLDSQYCAESGVATLSNQHDDIVDASASICATRKSENIPNFADNKNLQSHKIDELSSNNSGAENIYSEQDKRMNETEEISNTSNTVQEILDEVSYDDISSKVESEITTPSNDTKQLETSQEIIKTPTVSDPEKVITMHSEIVPDVKSDVSGESEGMASEAANSVRVTIDIAMPKSEEESMHVRLSMESLPTSSRAAEALDAMIPIMVEAYDSESCIDSDSLASISLPSTPSVSRSSSRLSDGRAGKYNKRPAPPRPESPPDDKPMKARLVLQPGVVRNLPEAMGESSEVFVRTPKQKRKKQHKNSGGIAAMFPFWKQETKQEEPEDKVPIVKMTNL